MMPPLIRSRYYVRNAKRVVNSLRVSHVVVGANERRLYSQAVAITSAEKKILMVLNEFFSVAKYFTFFYGNAEQKNAPSMSGFKRFF